MMMWKPITLCWRKVPPVDLVLALFIAVTVRLFLILRWPHFAYEDALITFRYAENLAKGIGFVYNPGERVLGSTTPLYGLVLALFHKLGLDIFVSAAVFNLVCDVVWLYLFMQTLMSTINDPARRDIAMAVGVFLGTYFPFLRVTVSRMETSLFLLFVTAALWAFMHRRQVLLGVVLGGLVLTRIDGLVLLVIILGWFLWRHRFVPILLLIGIGVLLIPYGLFTTVYFGSPIPHSAVAKAVIYPSVFADQFSRVDSLITLAKHIFAGNLYHRLLLVPFALVGFTILMRTRATWFMVLLALFILYFTGLGLSNTFVHEWYLAPLFLVYGVSVGSGIGLLGNRLLSVLKTSALGRSLVIVLLATTFVLVNVYIATDKTEKDYRFDRNALQNIGLYLREHASPNQSVLLEPIGYIGYYSGLRIYDAMGLVSPEAIVYFLNYGVKDYMVAWALDALPDFAVLRPPEFQQATPERYQAFLQRYQLAREVKVYNEVTRKEVVFMVFQRRE